MTTSGSSAKKTSVVFFLGYASLSQGNYGSELALTKLGRALDKIGYDVYVIEQTPTNQEGMTSITPHQYVGMRFDCLIISRYINFFVHLPQRADKTLIWIHDVIAHPAFNGVEFPDKGRWLLESVRRTDTQGNQIGPICITQTGWHQAVFSQVYPGQLVQSIPNGIDVERFVTPSGMLPSTGLTPPRVPSGHRFIWTSSPVRGLTLLLKIFPEIKKRWPESTLQIFRGPEEFTEKQFEEIKEMSQYVVYHGKVDNDQIVKEFLRANVWLYPTDFSETCCISAIEAQAAGCLCVCSNLAALGEIVNTRGVLLHGEYGSPNYIESIFKGLETVFANREKYSSEARKWALQQSWINRARQWAQLIGPAPEPKIMLIEDSLEDFKEEKTIVESERKTDVSGLPSNPLERQRLETIPEDPIKSNPPSEDLSEQSPNNPKTTLALLCNWSDSLPEDWAYMVPKDFGDHYTLTNREQEADLNVIFNGHQSRGPEPGDVHLTMEPKCNRTHFSAEWRGDGLNTRNMVEWHLSSIRLDDPKTHVIPKKTKCLSAIVSGENRLPGHKYRLALLNALDENWDSEMKKARGKEAPVLSASGPTPGSGDAQPPKPRHSDEFDLYGKHRHALGHYRGQIKAKEMGLFDYKYHLAIENCQEEGYFTEKIADGILAECLCFYWGCPNLQVYADSRSWVQLHGPSRSTDPAVQAYSLRQDLQTIVDAVADNLWEKSLPFIRISKYQMLYGWSIFPTIDRLLTGNTLIPAQFVDEPEGFGTRGAELPKSIGRFINMVINLDRRVDRWSQFTRDFLGLPVNRFSAKEGKEITSETVDELFTRNPNVISEAKPPRKNPYPGHQFKTGVLGCALSHYCCWARMRFAREFFPMVVFEDDARPVRDPYGSDRDDPSSRSGPFGLRDRFLAKLGAVEKYLSENRDWDICYLGYLDDQPLYNDQSVHTTSEGTTINKMDGKAFRLHGGGTHGYIVSPRGARRLYRAVNKYTIYQPVDWFMINMIGEILEPEDDEITDDLKEDSTPFVALKCNPPLVEQANPNDTDIQRDSSTVKH